MTSSDYDTDMPAGSDEEAPEMKECPECEGRRWRLVHVQHGKRWRRVDVQQEEHTMVFCETCNGMGEVEV